jgi:hypothetical protein
VKGVGDYAQKKGIVNPNVFVVSAKQEIEGETEDSGFKTIKKYIADNITGGKAPYLKLQNNINTSRNINQRIYDGLQLREEQWQADKLLREALQLYTQNRNQQRNGSLDYLMS